jgi:hypothetical protein
VNRNRYYSDELDVHDSVHRDIIVKITNKMQLYRLIYYSKSVLYVSGDVFAHYQEHVTVFTALVDFHLDAQNSYLFIYNSFIKILYMFRALPCSSSGGLRRNCIYAASGISSLSVGDCPVCTG